MQGLALKTTAKIVATAGAERVRPHLPTLVPALLEALSGLEVRVAQALTGHMSGMPHGPDSLSNDCAHVCPRTTSMSCSQSCAFPACCRRDQGVGIGVP